MTTQNTTRLGSLPSSTAEMYRADHEVHRRLAGETISKYKTYYYSGGQAEIYFSNIFIDEINSLQFQTVTNRSPIYGYASQLFDTIAKGNLIVHGSFALNFIQAGYLNIVAQHISDRETKYSYTRTGLQDIDTSTEFRTQQAINAIRGLGNQEFKQLAEGLGKENNNSLPITRFDRIDPFDIYAVFGDHRDEDANHTVRHIKHVYLTGNSQRVEANGQPIMDVYEFIAHDIL